MGYATTTDLEARWRTLTDDEKTRAETLLKDAAVRIDVECPPADPITDADARKIVSCEMVKRAMANPGGVGVTQMGTTTGPFSDQLTFANPTGDMYITKADRRLLACSRQVAFTVPLTGFPEE